MKHPETILDFGSSKIVCMVGNINRDNRFEVYGIGNNQYKGIKKGIFLDEASTFNAALKAIETAQLESKKRMNRVSIGVPGQFLAFEYDEVKLIYDDMHTITQEDIEMLYKLTKKNTQRAESKQYKRIHLAPINFKLDDIERGGAPVNLTANSMSATFFHIYMKSEFESFVEGILQEAGLKSEVYLDSALCESILLASQQKRNKVAIVVDVGYYHTEICVLQNLAPAFREIIAVGGANFSQDISYVLEIPINIAEEIKRRHVFALEYSGRKDSYKLSDGQIMEYEYEVIQEIIESRADELIQMIKRRLDEQVPLELTPQTPLYLCGGGLGTMRGGREYLQSKLGYIASTSVPWMPRNNSLGFLSAYGILKYICDSNEDSESQDWKNNPIISAMINFFTK